MTHTGRCLFLLLLASLLGGASGCFGISQNPSYFPYLLPTGDVVRTHAKPIGPGYYANFDPHAVDLAVEPGIITSQVGAQVIILATVRDAKGYPRRNRRVDWLVTNGNLIEVDESGVFNGRGAIDGNRGYSFTNHHEHRLSRGNANKLDDVMLRPGQSWCVVTSPVEGDTHVQVVVPGIYNWDKRMKTAIVRWVDATWEFPARAVAKFGTEHEFVTRVARHTDRLPLTNYRVRYKILDGPPAILLPSRTQEQMTITDPNGMAKVRIAQTTPASGVNRVSVEIIRPPDPTTPSGTSVPIVTGETSVDWLAPGVKLSHNGPPAAALNTNLVFTTQATNTGRLDSQWVEFTLPIPDGTDFVSSQPPAEPRNGQLVIPFGTLAVGQTHTVVSTFRAKRAGTIKSVAMMRTAEGQNDQKEATALVTTPQLKVELIAPKTGLVDVPINYVIRLSNPGNGDLNEIQVSAEFDKGLEHDKLKDFNAAKNRNYLEMTDKKGLKAGETRDETLILTPRQAGPLGVRVTAQSGDLKQEATHVVVVQKPNVSLRVEGPTKRFVGRPAEWKIYVKNEGEAEITGVAVRDRLPAEQSYKFASRNGNFANGEVTWNLGTLRPAEEVVLELTTEAQRAAAASEKTTMLAADGNLRTEKTARLEIQGIAALKMEMTDLNDPVEVGKTVVYRLTITNTGSALATRIEVKGTVPELMKAVRANGPSRETIAGRLITFDKMDLQPGAKLTYLFECEALKEGDARFRVEYTSELNPTPIFEEEPTRVIPPFVPGGAIPNPNPTGPPPPPPGLTPRPLPPG